MEWLAGAVRYFHDISAGLAALLAVLSVLFGSQDPELRTRIHKFFSNLKLPKIFRAFVDLFAKHFQKAWIKYLFLAVATFFCVGLLFELNDSLLTFLIILCLIIVARDPLLKLIEKRAQKNESAPPKPEIIDSKFRHSRLLNELGVGIAVAAALALVTKFAYFQFFSDQIIRIAVSEFEPASPEDAAIAKKFHISLCQYIEKNLGSEDVFFDAKLVKINSIIHNRREAEQFGKKQGRRAIVLWGLISGNSYTPQYTLINPPKGMALAEAKHSEIIHDLKDLQGQALDLASNAVSVTGFSIGLVHYWNKNYDSALRLFEKAFDQDHKNTAILFYIGNCQYYRGFSEKAALAYEQITFQIPNEVAPRNNLAVIRIDENKYANALVILEEARRLDAKSATVLINTGVVYHRLNNPEEAQRYMVAALQAEPDNAVAKNNIAAHAARMGDYHTALRFLEDAAESEDAPSQVFVNLGFLYYQHFEEYNKAVRAFSKASKMTPDDTSAALGLALVHLSRGNMDDAADWMAKIIDRSKVPATYYQRFGDALAEAQSYESAISCYRKSLHHDPTLISNYARMAQCAFQAKDTTGALSYVMIYARYNPSGVETLPIFHLGCVLSNNLGKPNEALDLCERAHKMAPQDHEHRRLYAIALLNLASDRRDPTTILEAFSLIEGLELGNDELADFHARAGNSYLEVNSYNQAIAQFQRALELVANHDNSAHNLPIAYQKLANDYIKKEQWSSALTALEHAFETSRESKEKAMILYTKAFVLDKQDSVAASRRQLQQFIHYINQENLQDDEEMLKYVDEARRIIRSTSSSL